jgi:hypothetical protein
MYHYNIRMSSNDSDLVNSLTELFDFLRQQDMTNTTRLKILLRSTTDDIATKFNKLVMVAQSSPKEKLDEMYDSLAYFGKILSILPNNDELEVIWMKISAMANILRSTLVKQFSYSDVASNYSSATILGDLLLDEVKQINELPEFPSSGDYMEFREIFTPTINLITSTCDIYAALINSLPVINRTDLVEWSNKILHMVNLFNELREKYTYRNFLQRKQIKEPARFYNYIFNLANTASNFAVHLKLIILKFGGNLPDTINHYGVLIPENLLVSYHRFISKTVKDNSKIMDVIEEARNNRWIDLNDKPEQSPFYMDYMLGFYNLNLTKLIIDMYDNDLLSNLEKSEKLMEGFNETMDFVFKVTGGLENAVKGGAFQIVRYHVNEIYPFIANHAVLLNDYSFFKDFEDKYKLVIEKVNPESDNQFYKNSLLSKLYVQTRITTDIDLNDCLFSLNNAIDHYQLKPRDFIALSLLKKVLEENLGKSNPLAYENLVEIGIPESQNEKYKEELLEYLKYLNSNANQLIDRFNHRKVIHPLDIYSWLYPNFESSSDEDNYKEYIPFNRYTDYVYL